MFHRNVKSVFIIKRPKEERTIATIPNISTLLVVMFRIRIFSSKNILARVTKRGGGVMGQHKRNPVAIAAKKGELPPKPPKKSKAEVDRYMYKVCQEELYRTVPSMPQYLKEVLSNG